MLPPEFKANRDPIVQFLAARGIETRAYFFPPIHEQTFFRKYADRPLPVTEDLSRRVITLPFYSSITEEEMRTVARGAGRSGSGVPSGPGGPRTAGGARMRVLVTGGAGYLGSVLVPKLIARGHQVRIVDLGYFGLDHLKRLSPAPQVVREDLRAILASPKLGRELLDRLRCGDSPGGDLERSVRGPAPGPDGRGERRRDRAPRGACPGTAPRISLLVVVLDLRRSRRRHRRARQDESAHGLRQLQGHGGADPRRARRCAMVADGPAQRDPVRVLGADAVRPGREHLQFPVRALQPDQGLRRRHAVASVPARRRLCAGVHSLPGASRPPPPLLQHRPREPARRRSGRIVRIAESATSGAARGDARSGPPELSRVDAPHAARKGSSRG